MNPIVPLCTSLIADLLPPLSLLIGLDPPLVAIYACNCQESKSTCTFKCSSITHTEGKNKWRFLHQSFLYTLSNLSVLLRSFYFCNLCNNFCVWIFILPFLCLTKHSDLISIYITVFKFSRRLK